MVAVKQYSFYSHNGNTVLVKMSKKMGNVSSANRQKTQHLKSGRTIRLIRWEEKVLTNTPTKNLLAY